MSLDFSFVKGLTFGLEYVNLDENDQVELETEGTLMIVLSLGIFRIVHING